MNERTERDDAIVDLATLMRDATYSGDDDTALLAGLLIPPTDEDDEDA